jgi:hypothetical protein
LIIGWLSFSTPGIGYKGVLYPGYLSEIGERPLNLKAELLLKS